MKRKKISRLISIYTFQALMTTSNISEGHPIIYLRGAPDHKPKGGAMMTIK